MNSAVGLMGDPFSEPQELNSVFDTDASMLVVIAAANKKMSALG